MTEMQNYQSSQAEKISEEIYDVEAPCAQDSKVINLFPQQINQEISSSQTQPQEKQTQMGGEQRYMQSPIIANDSIWNSTNPNNELEQRNIGELAKTSYDERTEKIIYMAIQKVHAHLDVGAIYEAVTLLADGSFRKDEIIGVIETLGAEDKKLLLQNLYENYDGREKVLLERALIEDKDYDPMIWGNAPGQPRFKEGAHLKENTKSPLGLNDKSEVVNDPNDTTRFSWTDPLHGQGDCCYLHASLSAIAVNHPEILRDMIQLREDGNYNVIFHIDGQKKVEIVSPSFPSYSAEHDIPVYGSSLRMVSGKPKELWPMLIEKAWVQLNGGNDYENINGGPVNTLILKMASSKRVFEQITGATSESISTDRSITEMTDILELSSKSGLPTTAQSRWVYIYPIQRELMTKYDLTPAHVYTVVYTISGTILLRDPNSGKIITMPIEDFKEMFSQIFVAHVEP